MRRLRLLYDDLWLLRDEYRKQRALHPSWRRLELIRAGLESLSSPWDGSRLTFIGVDPAAKDGEYTIVMGHHVREVALPPDKADWINDKLVPLDRGS